MTIYLYVKTHKKTGLKYLGKTEQDPHAYQGSGVYWTRHVKEHGYEVTTEILHECKTVEELKHWGLHYSELWNIVESNEWANLKEECGDGFSSGDAKRMWEDSSHRQKMSDCLKNLWQKEEFAQHQRELSSARLKTKWSDEQYRNEMIEKLRRRSDDLEFKKSQSTKCAKVWQDPEYRKNHSGKNSSSYDHTLYHFIHKDGREEISTRYDLQIKYNLLQPKLSLLVKGKIMSHKGWRLKSNA